MGCWTCGAQAVPNLGHRRVPAARCRVGYSMATKLDKNKSFDREVRRGPAARAMSLPVQEVTPVSVSTRLGIRVSIWATCVTGLRTATSRSCLAYFAFLYCV